MQVDPVSQLQQAVPAQETRPAPKPQAQVSQQLSAGSDTVVLSEKAKDLAAQQAGKAAQEEANESMAAKQREALSL